MSDVQGRSGRWGLTRHAVERIRQRNLSGSVIDLALMYGRVIYVRGAYIHVIGRKEIVEARKSKLDLSRYEGVQVVCSRDGAVLTVYRNRDFRGLRPRRHRWHAESGFSHLN